MNSQLRKEQEEETVSEMNEQYPSTEHDLIEKKINTLDNFICQQHHNYKVLTFIYPKTQSDITEEISYQNIQIEKLKIEHFVLTKSLFIFSMKLKILHYTTQQIKRIDKELYIEFEKFIKDFPFMDNNSDIYKKLLQMFELEKVMIEYVDIKNMDTESGSLTTKVDAYINRLNEISLYQSKRIKILMTKVNKFNEKLKKWISRDIINGEEIKFVKTPYMFFLDKVCEQEVEKMKFYESMVRREVMFN